MDSEPIIASVSRVNNYIKRLIDSKPVLQDLWVKGEISNYKRHSSGHLYMTLKDEHSVLKAIMFRQQAASLSFVPDNGLNVIAHGRVAAYEAYGEYQLYIDEMTPDGVGALYLQYEQLKKKLAAEGLFDEHHKKALPPYPCRIGVVTAPTGAAVRDIINVCTRRYPLAEIVVFPAIVQGAGAKESIVRGIEYFNNVGADVMIVGRGGGSIEDLWAFNEEIVARAIYASQIPIVSAVGHETDFTIADFVADRRAPTPSAAAELCVPSADELLRQIALSRSRMRNAVSSSINNWRKQLRLLTPRDPRDRINALRQRIDLLIQRIESHNQLKISRHRQQLASLSIKLDALSPLKTLSRGYAIPVNADGQLVHCKAQLPSGTDFSLTLADGKVECRTK